MTARTLAKKVASFALSKKAYDIVILDLRTLTSAVDFFVLCSADSDTQVRAVADAVRQGAEEIGSSLWHDEGYQASSWIILDFVDVVAHVFHRDTRRYYNLERLWGDAPRIEIGEDGEVGSALKRRTTRRTKAARPAPKS
ncbi:MAG TPA: ribosome silencing factor [Bacteroidota bacterium]|nr:ribosome silencing factor [Bacteroidota bacterium]